MERDCAIGSASRVPAARRADHEHPQVDRASTPQPPRISAFPTPSAARQRPIYARPVRIPSRRAISTLLTASTGQPPALNRPGCVALAWAASGRRREQSSGWSVLSVDGWPRRPSGFFCTTRLRPRPSTAPRASNPHRPGRSRRATSVSYAEQLARALRHHSSEWGTLPGTKTVTRSSSVRWAAPELALGGPSPQTDPHPQRRFRGQQRDMAVGRAFAGRRFVTSQGVAGNGRRNGPPVL
jgi:hypothetical protein